MNKLMAISGAALLALTLAGCASTHARETQLDLGPKTAALEPQDVRRTVNKMVDSMLVDQEFIRSVGGGSPILDITGIRNQTTMHLDTKSITDSIRTRLFRMHKFRFVDHTTAGEDASFANGKAQAGMADPAKQVRAGQQNSAQLILYGDLSEMRSQVDDVTDRYFKFTLCLKDLRSGEIIWTDEQEIRKEQVRNVMGF